jgi:hypothetical protein
VAAVATAFAMPASALAARPQPLNQYLVSNINPKALQRAGFDMSEAVTPRAKGEFAIVATPSQAAALRAKGAKVNAPFGATKQRPRSLRARASARAAVTLTHGYNVFRPWSLDPGPCPGTCATPNIPLKDWYHQYAAKFPSVVKEEVIGHSVQGQDIVAYKVTQWISTEVNRLLFKYFFDHSKDRAIKRLLQTREIWSVPMDNRDGFEDGLAPFTVPGPPAGSPGNANDWIQSASVGFQDGPGVRTDHSVYWGFGLEGVTGADKRSTLIGNALRYLGV